METLGGLTSERHSFVPARSVGAAGHPARTRYVDAVVDDYLDGSDSEGLLEYWRLLRRHKATILVGAFLGTLLGFLVSLPQTPIYRARTAIEIETLNENYLNLREVNPTTTSGSVASEFDISTQVKVLESRSLVEKVIDRLQLDKRPKFQHAPTRLASWRRALGVPGSPPAPAREQALEVAAGNFHVVPSRRTRIVEIFSEWPDPDLAAEFANALAETFIEHNLETRWKSTQRSGEWLTRQLEELRVKLEKSEEKLQEYARISGLLFTAEKESVAEQRLRHLQMELSRAEADRIGKQSRFEMATTSLPESLPDILDNGPLGTYQLKLTDLRRQLAELSASFTSAHPKIRVVEVQIDQLDKVVATERGHIVGRIRNEYETARRREKLLRSDYANQSRLVAEQGGRAIQYNIYKREVETNRQLYDNLLQRVKEAGVASAMRASNIRVIDPAKAPRSPHKPNHVLNAMLGLMAGTLLGIVFVFVGERADRTLKQPGDATQHLRVPELGVIPSSRSDATRPKGYGYLYGSRRRKGLNRSVAPRSENGKPKRADVEPAETVELTSWQRKPTLIAESFRATLTSILFAGENGTRPRVLVITSPSPGEGKTTVVSNLAICLAEINRRVLLIDADMRKPRVHKIFDTANRRGLSDLLRESGAIEQSGLAGFVSGTEIPGLFVLPSGAPTHSIPNLLHSVRTPELISCAKDGFDTVLIDTPPMMQISDARVLGQMADAVILVLRAGQTTRGTAKAASERFLDDGTRVLGTVLNSWNPKANGYGYYDNYYYESYYAEKEEERGVQPS